VSGGEPSRTAELLPLKFALSKASMMPHISQDSRRLALAQLVHTVTTRPGVRALRVLVDGQRVEVARADGTLTNGDLTRGDYRPLLASS
jgi:hypothetical protein